MSESLVYYPLILVEVYRYFKENLRYYYKILMYHNSKRVKKFILFLVTRNMKFTQLKYHTINVRLCRKYFLRLPRSKVSPLRKHRNCDVTDEDTQRGEGKNTDQYVKTGRRSLRRLLSCDDNPEWPSHVSRRWGLSRI